MQSKRTAALGAAVLTTFLASPPASARTPYILPNAFDVQGSRVSLIGATTEDDYFTPDGALNVPAYQETLPDGRVAEVKPAALLKDMAVTEVALDAPGTYRFSTGQFVQRTQTWVKIAGEWKFIRGARPGAAAPSARPAHAEGAKPQEGRPAGAPGGGDAPPNSIAAADAPADAPRMTVEGVQVIETYVTKGAPTEAAVKPTGKGFELAPATHPNAVYLDQGFAFQLLLDGKPAADLPISVYRAGNIYDDRRIAVETKSDARGMAKVRFAQPGVYLITTHTPGQGRTPAEAPPAHVYTYSLTLEVTR